MSIEEKALFLSTTCFEYLKQLNESKQPSWGKMNAQQMLEHVNDFYEVSTGKLQFALTTPEEHLPKYKEFLYSDKPFRENTKAPETVLGDEPLPMRMPSLEAAAAQLQNTVAGFFESKPHPTTIHPVFGPLSFDEWILLHYKHVTHHWNQFELLR